MKDGQGGEKFLSKQIFHTLVWGLWSQKIISGGGRSIFGACRRGRPSFMDLED